MTSNAVGGTRRRTSVTATIASGAALSDAIDVRAYGAGIVIMPAAWTTADLGLQVCPTATGTFAPLRDTSNGYSTDVSVDAAEAGPAYPLPDYIFAAGYIKLWSHNGSGVDVNQAAERTFTVMLKA